MKMPCYVCLILSGAAGKGLELSARKQAQDNVIVPARDSWLAKRYKRKKKEEGKGLWVFFRPLQASIDAITIHTCTLTPKV